MIRKVVSAVLGLVVATPVSAAWHEASSAHFVVYADERPATVAAYANKLERFDKALRVFRGVADQSISPSARIIVFIVPTTSAFEALRGSEGSLGYYRGSTGTPVAFVAPTDGKIDIDPLTILLHEYCHHFMRRTWTKIAFPAWVSEGFAEFQSNAEFADNGDVLLGSGAHYRADAMLDDRTMPAEKLLSGGRPDDARESAAFYARAWLLTHYLSVDPARRPSLAAYLDAIRAGRSLREAAALLGDPAKLDTALNHYIEQGRLFGFKIPAAKLTIAPVQVRALPPGAAAAMPARMASLNGVTPENREKVAELARAVAARYPDDAFVQTTLAKAEYDAHHWDATKAAADRALAADPNSLQGMMYNGLARGAALREARSIEPAAWAEVRKWFSRANRVETEYAVPLALFYDAFISERQRPSANAQAALLYARDLAPFDRSLGLKAAYVLLQQGKPAEAAALLKPITTDPHGGGTARVAAAIITATEHGGASSALALFGRPGFPPSWPAAKAE